MVNIELIIKVNVDIFLIESSYVEYKVKMKEES